jgi:anti-sigma-K factor RskA
MTDELDMLAAEYVLGTLGPEERAAFESRVAADAEAKRAVDEWTRRLSPLAQAVKEVEPPAGLWDKIQRQLQPQNPGQAAPAVLAANDNLTVELRRSARRWRNAFIAVSALAASLAAFVVYREQPGRELPRGSYVAIVRPEGGRPAVIVNVNPASKSAYVIPVAAEAPAGRSLQLWFIGNGEKPKSMGLVKAQAERLSLPAGADVENALLAISVEPEGGLPAGAEGPTGPVIYSGPLVKS